LQVLVVPWARAADDKVLLDLNCNESSENRCRMNLVFENKSALVLNGMKLDLVAFGADGGIMCRLITEMAPLRPMKTVVRTLVVEVDCRQISAVLVNDVSVCVPGDPNAMSRSS
jgi:hypothetical protein